jgi:hypothetical protein
VRLGQTLLCDGWSRRSSGRVREWRSEFDLCGSELSSSTSLGAFIPNHQPSPRSATTTASLSQMQSTNLRERTKPQRPLEQPRSPAYEPTGTPSNPADESESAATSSRPHPQPMYRRKPVLLFVFLCSGIVFLLFKVCQGHLWRRYTDSVTNFSIQGEATEHTWDTVTVRRYGYT